jgi:hypothetical protein
LRTLPFLHLAAPLLVTAALLPAQAPGSWVPLQLGSPYSLGAVSQLGKILAYREGGRQHVFSAFTRRWRSVAVSATVTTRVANDWLLVEDGTTWHAFSAWRGVFETITVGVGATYLNPANNRNDSLIVVRDGGDFVVFSGFTGRWVRRPVGPGARLAVQDHTLVVADGTTLLGISAFDGSWVTSSAAAAATNLAADGTVGALEAGGTIHAFSAHTRQWMTAPIPAAATRLVAADVILWWNQAQALAFSGLRGAFTTTAILGVTTAGANERSLALVAPAGAWLYSASRGAFTFHAMASPTALLRTDVVLLQDAAGLAAFSALTGTVAPLPGAFGQVGANTTTAAAVDQQTGRPHLFSAFTGTWSPAPADALPNVLPEQTWNAALVTTTTGFKAFSARSGRFVALAPGATPVQHVDANSAILAVSDASAVHVFEPRREVWLSAPRGGSGPMQTRIWRTTFLGIDGQDLFGFGASSGTLEKTTVTGAIADFNANSESLRVATASTLLGFAGVADLTTSAQFPEFRRQQPRGAPLGLHVAAPPSSFCAAVLGLRAGAPIPLPVGEFLIDPSALFPFPFPPVDLEGRSALPIAVPDDAALAGLQVLFQVAVMPPAGQAYLTRLAAVTIH